MKLLGEWQAHRTRPPSTPTMCPPDAPSTRIDPFARSRKRRWQALDGTLINEKAQQDAMEQGKPTRQGGTMTPRQWLALTG